NNLLCELSPREILKYGQRINVGSHYSGYACEEPLFARTLTKSHPAHATLHTPEEAENFWRIASIFGPPPVDPSNRMKALGIQVLLKRQFLANSQLYRTSDIVKIRIEYNSEYFEIFLNSRSLDRLQT
ncbi:unnamed protein product, partial [Heterotrigona itama]